VNHLSGANLRAALTVLVAGAGVEVHITNAELYEAMMPANGLAECFLIESTGDGVCVSIEDSYGGRYGRRGESGGAAERSPSTLDSGAATQEHNEHVDCGHDATDA
jgi:hypothetical protein